MKFRQFRTKWIPILLNNNVTVQKWLHLLTIYVHWEQRSIHNKYCTFLIVIVLLKCNVKSALEVKPFSKRGPKSLFSLIDFGEVASEMASVFALNVSFPQFPLTKLDGKSPASLVPLGAHWAAEVRVAASIPCRGRQQYCGGNHLS